jgi:hypothetical protein
LVPEIDPSFIVAGGIIFIAAFLVFGSGGIAAGPAAALLAALA